MDETARAPFAADVSEGRADPLYNAHGYHTKIPPRAIARYLLYYTRPGDLVYDGFCGSGMTGVAAQWCGVATGEWRTEVEREWRRARRGAIEWGARRACLRDLSPAATFIADGHNRAVSDWQPAAVAAAAEEIANEVERALGERYRTDGGRILHALWSEVFSCPACGGEMIYWRVAVDERAGVVRARFPCPACGALSTKRQLARVWDEFRDPKLGRVVKLARAVPIELTCEAPDGRRFTKKPDSNDLKRIENAHSREIEDWYPTTEIPDGDKSGDAFACGVRHVHHLFTPRNLAVISKLWALCRARGLGWLVTGIMQRASKQHQVAVSRFGPKRGEGGKTAGHRRGTLYIPSNQIEFNPIELFRERARVLVKACGLGARRENVAIETGSAARSNLLNDSVDYIFIDPPFGANIQYSELNRLWEAWLGEATQLDAEAVINQTRKKDLSDYRALMEDCFKDFFRVLKPGHWMTLVFHNSQRAVWDAIHQALLAAGFVVADVRTLDKQIKTHTQRTAALSVRTDLVISAQKPRTANGATIAKSPSPSTGDEASAWRFVARRLRALPARDAERAAHLLFDRMVAFHLGRGETVPLGAPEFYAGLNRRFTKKGDLYFVRKKTKVTARARNPRAGERAGSRSPRP